MARHWLREALAEHEGRVDPTEYAMALFSAHGDTEHSEEVARALTDEPADWRELADQHRHDRARR